VSKTNVTVYLSGGIKKHLVKIQADVSVKGVDHINMFHFWISKKPSSRRMWLIFIFSLLLLHLVCSSYNTATLVMFRNSYLLTLSSNLRFRCELVLLHCTLLYCLLPATCSKLTCGSQHFRLHVLHTRLLYVASKLEVRLRLP
jgi:hypothetical protein